MSYRLFHPFPPLFHPPSVFTLINLAALTLNISFIVSGKKLQAELQVIHREVLVVAADQISFCLLSRAALGAHLALN